jgi:hypothetical protein
MGKIDLLIYPKTLKTLFQPPPDVERKYYELLRKLKEVEPPDYYYILAKKGLAELARIIEERLKKLGIPYILIRGLEPSSEKDIEYVVARAKTTLEEKFRVSDIPLLQSVEVLRVPRYEEWVDPPEEGSAPNWLWLVAGVAGAIAVPLLLAWLKKP